MRTLIERIAAARGCATPLVFVSSADQPACVANIVEHVNGGPQIGWDRIRGWRALNTAAAPVLKAIASDDAALTKATANPIEMLVKALDHLPEDCMVLARNFHMFLRGAGSEAVIQGVANLRDAFKASGRTFIALAPSWGELPLELQSDVVVLHDPLPTDDELRTIVANLYSDGEQQSQFEKGVRFSDEVARQAVDAGRGLSAFSWEQRAAMSLGSKGLDMEEAWEHKRAAINQHKGLKMGKPTGMTFDKLRGIPQICRYGSLLFAGPEPPGIIVFIDEIEKAVAGFGSDTSGVTTEMVGALLRQMEDRQWGGMILVGPPGVAKTAYGNALGETHGARVIGFDIGGMKGKHVGESETQIRTNFDVVEALGGGRVFCVATCNNLDVMPPELLRRFTSGTWFLDLPSAEERAEIWPLYLKRYGLDLKQPRPDDDQWTGAEIRNCCREAYRTKLSVAEASQFIVPAAFQRPERITGLRTAANNKFLSASYPGRYLTGGPAQAAATGGRALKLGGRKGE